VALEISDQLAIRQIPHLNETIPAAGDDDGILRIRREFNTARPERVAVFLDGEFAFAECVP